jgi:serine/threonine protein kinase
MWFNFAERSSWDKILSIDVQYLLYGRYEKIAKIGQGTFGEVFKARCRSDKNKIVALKKVLMENEKEVRFWIQSNVVLFPRVVQ